MIMKKTALYLIILFSVFSLYSQNDINWNWSFISSGSEKDFGLKIALDGDNNLYGSGYFSDTLIFGNDTLISSGTEDYYVIKVDSNGNYIWSFQVEGTGTIRDIDVQQNGELYFTGLYNGSLNLSGNSLTGGLGYIAKYDSSGSYVWSKNIESTGGYLLANTVDVDIFNNIYLLGDFYEDIYIDTITHITGTYPFENNFFIAKFNDTGSGIWIKSAMTDYMGMTGSVDMVTDENGNIYVLSIITNSADFGNGVIYTHTAMADGSILIKYNAAGQAQWYQSASSDAGVSHSMDLSYDNTYGIYYSGYANGDMTIGGTTFPIDFSLSIEGYYIKYDTSGNYLWAKSFGSVTGNDDMAVNISFDMNGNGYLMGCFGDTIIVAGDTLTGTDTSSVLIADNLFFAQLDSSGTMIEAKKANLTLEYSFYGEIMLDENGILYLVGYDMSNSKNSTKSSSSNSFFGKSGLPPDPIIISLSSTDASCDGMCDGTISLNMTGGTPPFSYFWSNGSTGQQAYGLCPGIYCVTVTDIIGDTASYCIEIYQPDAITLTLVATDDTGTGNGTATVTPAGGVPPYLYNWSSGDTDSTATGLIAGIYIVTVNDFTGCYAIDTVEVLLNSMSYENCLPKNIRIYPNPSKGKFIIQLDDSKKLNNLEIWSVNGEKLCTYGNQPQLNDSVIEIDLTEYNSGLYFLKMTVENNLYHTKLIVQ